MLARARILTDEQLAKIAADRRDRQDDDWSGYAGFNVDYIEHFLSNRHLWVVLANNYIRVGTYDTYQEASIVKAKLEYRRKEPVRGMIGLDGIPA